MFHCVVVLGPISVSDPAADEVGDVGEGAADIRSGVGLQIHAHGSSQGGVIEGIDAAAAIEVAGDAAAGLEGKGIVAGGRR